MEAISVETGESRRKCVFFFMGHTSSWLLSWLNSFYYMLLKPILFLLLRFPPLSRDHNDFPHSSTTAGQCCVYLPVMSMRAFIWYMSCNRLCVCVCVRKSRHLEGHDKVCEMKLGLQVQLDGHVLHTCSGKQIHTYRKWTIRSVSFSFHS